MKHLILSFLFFTLVLISESSAEKFKAGSINKVYFSEWVQFSTELEDGRKVFQSQVIADDPVTDGEGKKRALVFAIECRGKESTAALVLVDSKLEIDAESTVVEIQADNEKTQQITFHPSANKKSLIIRDNATAIKLVQGLYDKANILVKAGLTSPETIKAEFDIGRIETAVEPIAKACKWQATKSE